MNSPTPCRCCGDPVRPLDKNFDECLGFTCRECHTFLNVADEVLEIAGCAGIWVKPFQPNKPKL